MDQIADFSITSAGVPTVGADGQIDLSNAEELRQTIETAALDEAYGIVADLGQVTYLDTTVLTLLDDLCQVLARKNVELHVVLPEDGNVRRTLRRVEWPERVSAHESLGEAQQAAIAHTVEATTAVVNNLRAALATREVIGIAQGMLMATGQQWSTPQEAFEALRQDSQHRNIKLRDLAQELVDQASTHAQQNLTVATGPEGGA